MEREAYIVAIDLGSTMTRVVAGQYEEGKPFGLNIIYKNQQSSRSLRRGEVETPAEERKIVENLLLGAERAIKNDAAEGKSADAKKKKDKTVQYILGVNISGLKTWTTEKRELSKVEGGIVTRRLLQDLDTKARNSVLNDKLAGDETVFDTTVMKYYLDGTIGEDDVIGKRANEIEGRFLVHCAKRALVNNVLDSFPEGKKPTYRKSTASSKAEILLMPDVLKEGVALVDLGAQTMGVAIYYDKALVKEVTIPLGMDTVTRDLATEFGMSTEDAEEVKLTLGVLSEESGAPYSVMMKDGREILCNRAKYNSVVKARVEELAAYVSSQLDLELKKITAVYLTGGGANMTGVKDIFASRIGRPVNIARIDVGTITTAELQTYACAIGMASTVAKELHEINVEEAKAEVEKKAKEEAEVRAKAEAKPEGVEKEEKEEREQSETGKGEERAEPQKKGFWSRVKGFVSQAMNDDFNNKE